MPASWFKLLKNISIVTAILGVSVLLGCSDSTNFANRLTAEVRKGAGNIVTFVDLTDFDWDTVYVYGPYHPLDKINGKHGSSLKGEFGWSHVSEGDCLYVFEGDGKTIQAAYHPRSKGSCVEILEPGLYNPDNAVFKVQAKVPGSHPILKWAPPGRLQPIGANS